MIKAIAYDTIGDSQTDEHFYLITCEEGTSWAVESVYLRDKNRPVYSPYTGQEVMMVNRMGAMRSQVETRFP